MADRLAYILVLQRQFLYQGSLPSDECSLCQADIKTSQPRWSQWFFSVLIYLHCSGGNSMRKPASLLYLGRRLHLYQGTPLPAFLSWFFWTVIAYIPAHLLLSYALCKHLTSPAVYHLSLFKVNHRLDFSLAYSLLHGDDAKSIVIRLLLHCCAHIYI